MKAKRLTAAQMLYNQVDEKRGHVTASAINNRGQIVGEAGYYATTAGQYCWLYSGGTITELGTLGGQACSASAINSNGEIVGESWLSDNSTWHAFLYSDGILQDLNSLIDSEFGTTLVSANAINDRGQIVANGSNGRAYLLTPAGLGNVNPYACYVDPGSGCFAGAPDGSMTVSDAMLVMSPSASQLAADGISAAALVVTPLSNAAVTFTITAPDAVGAFGSLAPFDPNYLSSPSPTSGQTSLDVTPTCNASGSCTASALLWSPPAMPVAPSTSSFPAVTISITATQGSSTLLQSSILLEPPPLLLVHGIWSSAAGAWPPFANWLSSVYPHNLIQTVDYGPFNYEAFSDPDIQQQISSSMSGLLASAAANGMAARSVDVVAHSMGGLVTRYFRTHLPPQLAAVASSPIHRLITIGTPHGGSAAATALAENQGNLTADPILLAICNFRSISPCSLGNVFASLGKKVGSGVLAMQPGSTYLRALSDANDYDAVIGIKPIVSGTEALLNFLIGGFVPGQSLYTILGTDAHDTLVTDISQSKYASDSATIPLTVHTALVPTDTGETGNPEFWGQALYWISGGTGQAPSSSNAITAKLRPMDSSGGSIPMLNLAGYTQIDASNVTFAPASGSALSINSPATITATSSKTITEILLFQTVADPTDVPLLYSTQAPFSISFTPTRMGSANFVAFAVFNDNTFAATNLNYTLQASGSPSFLNLNVPQGSLISGTSAVIHVQAGFSTGLIDVTSLAMYAAGSGTSAVFSINSPGILTANGAGVDTLNVSYGGVSASAQIFVGSCSYALAPSNQLVDVGGGAVSVQVTAGAGCAWTTTSNAGWLTAVNASGNGSGIATFTAAANASGAAQTAFVTVAGQTGAITQAATACTYSLSQNQINAAAAGQSGTITVTTSCPVLTSSNASWLTASSTGATVAYTVATNTSSVRSAALTIGNQTVPVTQAASPGTSGNSGTALQFIPVTPCRVADTRNANGPFGGPLLSGQRSRDFEISSSGCSIPSTAEAYALNVTAVPSGQLRFLTVWPSGSAQPVVSTLNSYDGRIKANAAIVPAGTNAAISVFATDDTQVILDIFGYFVPAGTSSALAFYPLTPCRVADTRGSAGPLGRPSMTTHQVRDFPIQSSSCNVPTNAQAYSLNFTVVPSGPLSFLTAWPSGQSQPNVSTLNDPTGTFVANAAIVPAGTNGNVSVYVTDNTDVVIDINGYFAPPATGGLSLYNLTPCRVLDTRTVNGGQPLAGGTPLPVTVPSSSCSVPTAAAYVFNTTVIPSGSLIYLSMWPGGLSAPVVSTLNAPDRAVTSNMAIVPADATGSINVYTSSASQVILDIFGYFAP